MKLTKEQSAKIIQSINSLSPGFSCQICKNNSLYLTDTIFELREYNGGSLRIGGEQEIFPVIPVTCEKCGNTIFINALVYNLLEKKEDSTNG